MFDQFRYDASASPPPPPKRAPQAAPSRRFAAALAEHGGAAVFVARRSSARLAWRIATHWGATLADGEEPVGCVPALLATVCATESELVVGDVSDRDALGAPPDAICVWEQARWRRGEQRRRGEEAADEMSSMVSLFVDGRVRGWW